MYARYGPGGSVARGGKTKKTTRFEFILPLDVVRFGFGQADEGGVTRRGVRSKETGVSASCAVYRNAASFDRATRVSEWPNAQAMDTDSSFARVVFKALAIACRRRAEARMRPPKGSQAIGSGNNSSARKTRKPI